MIDYETFKEMKTSAKVSPIDAEMINWDEDFKPIFDSQDANATSIRGTATVDWLFKARNDGTFNTGVRTYQREKVATTQWKQEVMRTVLEDAFKSIPEIHIRVNEDGTYELTDGQQRTSAPLDYMNNEFPLPKDFIMNDGQADYDLSGLYYRDLIGDLSNFQNHIKSYEIVCRWYVKLDDQEVSDLFIDVLNNNNTMNAQEIRNAVLGVYSDWVRDTARQDPMNKSALHDLFKRNVIDGKEELKYFSKSFKLKGRMEVDEWLQNLCFMLTEGHHWTKGCHSQPGQIAWVKEIQAVGGRFATEYTESKFMLSVLKVAKDIMENTINRQRYTPMVSLMLVCYAIELIGITGKGNSRKLNTSVNTLDARVFAAKFEEVFIDWNDTQKELYKNETMYYPSNHKGNKLPMEPFGKLFGGKNAMAIGTIKKVLDKYTPAEWGVKVRDGRITFTKEQKMERLGQQEGKCFWTGAELGDTPIAGDHYIPRSKGGKTEKTNLVVTSNKLNNLRSNTSPKDFSDSLGVDIDHAANLVRLNNNEKCQWN
jgi:hypothetical protein